MVDGKTFRSNLSSGNGIYREEEKKLEVYLVKILVYREKKKVWMSYKGWIVKKKRHLSIGSNCLSIERNHLSINHV